MNRESPKEGTTAHVVREAEATEMHHKESAKAPRTSGAHRWTEDGR